MSLVATTVRAPFVALSGRAQLLFVTLAAGGFMALLAPPFSASERFDFLGSGICHQLGGHSYTIDGVQLPLCARCTGIYLGAFLSLGFFLVRGRAMSAQLPRMTVMIPMMLALPLMAFDGINSLINYAAVESGAALSVSPLYEPQNIFRIVTGALVGIAIMSMLLPVLNLTLWKRPDSKPIIGGWREMGVLAVIVAAAIAVVHFGPALALEPIALMSGLGLVAVVFIINLIAVVSIAKRDGQAARRSQVLGPALIALLLAVGELSLLAGARGVATSTLGLPL